VPAPGQLVVSASPGAGFAAQPIYASSSAASSASSAESAEGTAAGQQPITTIAASGSQGSPSSDGAPLQMPAPPTTTVVGGSSGCGGAGMGHGAAKGSAPAGAVLVDPARVDLAGNATAHTAQVAGPVVTTTADPATRPD
jgi:hypothetical protein